MHTKSWTSQMQNRIWYIEFMPDWIVGVSARINATYCIPWHSLISDSAITHWTLYSAKLPSRKTPTLLAWLWLWSIIFGYSKICTCSFMLKFGFSEKATKFEEDLCRTFDKSVVFCARNSVLVKKSTKIFQNKCGQVILYKLYHHCFKLFLFNYK